MISATVASRRRCRMSITCRSRRESVGVVAGALRAMGEESEETYAENSAVLIFQHGARFVKAWRD